MYKEPEHFQDCNNCEFVCKIDGCCNWHMHPGYKEGEPMYCELRKGIRMLTNNEKLDLINSMEFIDWSCASGECEYVLVEDNEANRNILIQIGITEDEIDKYVCEEAIDISIVAWEKTEANWFSGKEKKFYYSEES